MRAIKFRRRANPRPVRRNCNSRTSGCRGCGPRRSPRDPIGRARRTHRRPAGNGPTFVGQNFGQRLLIDETPDDASTAAPTTLMKPCIAPPDAVIVLERVVQSGRRFKRNGPLARRREKARDGGRRGVGSGVAPPQRSLAQMSSWRFALFVEAGEGRFEIVAAGSRRTAKAARANPLRRLLQPALRRALRVRAARIHEPRFDRFDREPIPARPPQRARFANSAQRRQRRRPRYIPTGPVSRPATVRARRLGLQGRRTCRASKTPPRLRRVRLLQVLRTARARRAEKACVVDQFAEEGSQCAHRRKLRRRSERHRPPKRKHHTRRAAGTRNSTSRPTWKQTAHVPDFFPC